jgi:hypothetical protein
MNTLGGGGDRTAKSSAPAHGIYQRLALFTCVQNCWSLDKQKQTKNKLRGFSPQSELYRSSDRRLSAKSVPTLANRGRHVVSATNPQRVTMMDILSENNKKEYPKSVTELLRLEEKRFLQGVCCFINNIPIFIKIDM